MRLDLIGILFAGLGLCMLMTNLVSGLVCIAAGSLMVLMGMDT